MGQSYGVQFSGEKQVIEAYEANAVPVWALFCGKEILGQYKGDDVTEGAVLLGEWMRRLKDGQSTSHYQVRMYEDPLKGSITPSTPPNYSFRFRLLDEEEARGVSRSRSPYFIEMEERIKKLEAEKEDLEEEEEIGGIQGFVAGILNDPTMKQALMSKVIGFISGFMGHQPQPASMSGVTTEPAETVDMTLVYQNMPEGQRTQLDAALRILLTTDPLAGERLYKIAHMLKTNPTKYEMLAGML